MPPKRAVCCVQAKPPEPQPESEPEPEPEPPQIGSRLTRAEARAALVAQTDSASGAVMSAPPPSPSTPVQLTREGLVAPTSSVKKMLMQPGEGAGAEPLDRDALMQRSTSVSQMFADPARGQASAEAELPVSLAGQVRAWRERFLDRANRPEQLALEGMAPEELDAHKRALVFKITEWVAHTSLAQGSARFVQAPELIAFAEEHNLFHLEPEEVYTEFVDEHTREGGSLLSPGPRGDNDVELGRFVSLPPEVEGQARKLRGRQATPVNATDDKHWKLLCLLWRKAGQSGSPSREAEQDDDSEDEDDPVAAMRRVSSRSSSASTPQTRRASAGRAGGSWTALGFQNEEPATDFRGSGLLGLECYVYLAEQYSGEFGAMLGLPSLTPSADVRSSLADEQRVASSEQRSKDEVTAEMRKRLAHKKRPPLASGTEQKRRLQLALLVIHVVDMLSKLLGLEHFSAAGPPGGPDAAPPSMLLAKALQLHGEAEAEPEPEPEAEPEAEPEEALAHQFEELVSACILRFARLWVGVRAEHAQFEKLIDVLRHQVRSLLLAQEGACSADELQEWAAEAPPKEIPTIPPPPQLPEPELQRVRGIRLRIPVGSGPVGIRLAPVEVAAPDGGEQAPEAAAREVVLVVKEVSVTASQRLFSGRF